MDLKPHNDWTTLPCFYCNKHLIDAIIGLHTERETKMIDSERDSVVGWTRVAVEKIGYFRDGLPQYAKRCMLLTMGATAV